MKLVDLKFKPGIDKQDTAYSAGDQRMLILILLDFTMENLKDGTVGHIYQIQTRLL